jgi:hypothetical protein
MENPSVDVHSELEEILLRCQCLLDRDRAKELLAEVKRMQDHRDKREI